MSGDGPRAETQSHLVGADWLLGRLGAANVVVADASWHLPAAGRDPRAEYLDGHIPGAVFFDIDAISDRASPLAHMLPSPDEFAAAMAGLGIADGDTVVVYDTIGFYSAARGWWMLTAMGAADVRVLDGGLPAWKAAGGAVEAGEVERQRAHFTARFKPERVASRETVSAAIEASAPVIVDARARERFRGEAAEPRPGVRAGHIPGARNLPYAALLTEDGRMRSPSEVAAAFEAADVPADRPLITSCGSGITASILTLALHEIGRDDVAVYDGSWSEWGADPDLPIATGA